ncbi:hypothetical protein C8J57DRAFT_1566441 [Mycena rebaudengoi]|nr:hypothetical protein C8J57DRAFT_1566441 [Mycena rebaudengoi]
MYKHWSGKFKGLDTGIEDYEISDAVWTVIWQETADAAWCFWIIYMAPALLKGRFRNEKYYEHACQYSSIIKRCIAFELTYDQIDQLEDDIIDWVEKYEKYYYQYDESRLSACPLTIHGWLHVPDNIRFCGPSWTTWTFYMERFCGWMQSGLRSRRFPWSNLNNLVLHRVYLEQIHPLSILRPPFTSAHMPDKATIRRIAGYFSAVLETPRKRIQPLLPEVMPSWGKVRIVEGDSIRSLSACGDGVDSQRDMSFVRVLYYRLFYGRLEKILECELPDDELFGEYAATTRLLAIITPCVTSGKDAAQEYTSYNRTTTEIVTDLQTVVAVVGRAETQGKWVIIDRTGGLIHPVFID